jgi:tRNA pseudouridine38-40 synthase
MTRKTRRNIRLVVAYDGTGYGGWQRQDNAPSVQAELEKALAKMHGSSPPVFAAGRTDAGVHAQAQVANFYTDIGSIPAERFVPALNKLLPRDIRVMSATEVPLDFHSRFDARLRRYRYFIVIGRTVDPFALRTAWQVTRSPDLRALNEAASLLLGENDFTALCSARDPSPSKRRTVLEASFRWEGGLLVFEIAANAFLLRMVRSITGSLIHWEAGGGPTGGPAGTAAETLQLALATGNRALAGPTAPAQGLFFWNAEYYEQPRRPGRGTSWSRRGYEEPQGGSGDEPVEPGPLIPPTGPAFRLVPGIGNLEE